MIIMRYYEDVALYLKVSIYNFTYREISVVRYGKINGANRDSNSGSFLLSPQACHSGCATTLLR